MKISQLIVLALGGVVLYLVYSRTKQQAPSSTSVTQSATGGSQNITSDNTFASVLGAVTAGLNVFNAAQTAPKSL